MRFVQAIVGILISAPTLLFSWIGAQTFVRSHERWLATVLTLTTFALLGLSVALLVKPSVYRVQLAVLAATLVLIAIALALAKRGT